MTITAMVFAAAFLGTIIVLGRAVVAVLRDLFRTTDAGWRGLREAFEDDVKTVRAEMRDLEDMVDRLPRRWEEIKSEAGRLDSRARYAVKRVREELSERGLTDDRIEELGHELQLVDGSGGGEEEVPAVRPDVEGEPAANDWRALAHARKYGG